MRKLNKREMVLLSIFIGLLLITLFVNSWLTPYLNKRDELLLERENLQMQWEKISIYKDKETEIQKSIVRLEEEAKQMKEMVPNQHSSHKYWDSILQKAKASNVEVLTIQEGEIGSEAKTMTASLSIQGTFDATLKFIDNLKAMPYLYAVKEGSLTEVDGGDFITSLSLDFYFSD